MADSYDRYEKRAPRSRDVALLRDLRGILSVSRSRAAVLRTQLKGIEIDTLKTRADLAQIPVMRKSELTARQTETLPFGGACGTRPGALQRLLMSPGPIFQPEGHAKDWWNSARALFAAGIRKGDIILNCFSYHFTPDGHMIDCGARALGCPVIPAGHSDIEATLAVIDHYRPVAYCGPAAYLGVLMAKSAAGAHEISSIQRAFVADDKTALARKMDLSTHGIALYEAYMTGDLGVVAYESDARGALIVNEGLIVEIVKPGTNEPLPVGEVGEIVVTRLNADYPLLRFGTGDLSCVIAGPSSCGRTNMRIRSPMGRVDESVEIAGRIIAPSHVLEIGAGHADLQHMRLIVRDRDLLVLQVESAVEGPVLRDKLTAALFSVTKIRGMVEIVPPGSLSNDDRLIRDERPKQA
jgi:phenylacetate-CoA ligase